MERSSVIIVIIVRLQIPLGSLPNAHTLIAFLCFLGVALAAGITLKYSDLKGSEQTTTIHVRADNSKKQAGAWVVALQKVSVAQFSRTIILTQL